LFAEQMGLPLQVLEFNWQELVQDLPGLIKRSGSPSLYSIAYQMITEVTIPVALEAGFKELWNGTGADLLFAGGRDPREYGEPWGEEWRQRFWDSQLGVWYWRYSFVGQPGESLPQWWSPMSTWEMMKIARRIHPKALWREEHDKVTLRIIAERWGVPHEIAWRPKDPAQNASGMFATLEALMLEGVDQQTEHRVSHTPKPEKDPLLALRIWMAWQAERAGITPQPSPQPLQPPLFSELHPDWRAPKAK
jgi:asparagine synthetase B (glutamine-hydrolysing)